MSPPCRRLTAVIDAEVTRRLPDYGTILIDPAILGVALPLSGKAVAPGFGLMPRGSVSLVEGEILRFFVYWKQRSERTDYDLSALLLTDDFLFGEQVSWTNYHAGEGDRRGLRGLLRRHHRVCGRERASSSTCRCRTRRARSSSRR